MKEFNLRMSFVVGHLELSSYQKGFYSSAIKYTKAAMAAKMSDFVWYQVIAYDETWP